LKPAHRAGILLRLAAPGLRARVDRIGRNAMPHATVNGIEMFYEQAGEGPDLLLIMGFGASGIMWEPLLPHLTPHFRVTWFDNRGTGLSDKPAGAYPMETMAADAAGLLEAIGVERAHVFGISMGGMVAQHLALRHPEKVERLILACTSAGGPEAAMPEPWAMEILTRPRAGRTPEQHVRDAVPILFTEAYAQAHPETIDAIIRRAAERPSPPEGVQSQLLGIMGHNVRAELGGLAAPTLLITGDADVLVPAENSRQLAAAIPGAALLVLPGIAHGLIHEATGEVAEAARTFLIEQRAPALDELQATAG
jgi:pimeloyl-ACP methyl ester carboxylesterase